MTVRKCCIENSINERDNVMNNIDVVIVGGLHHNTLGVLRSLGEKGIPKSQIRVLLIGKRISKNNLISKSKYIYTDYVTCIERYEEIIPWLVHLADDKKRRVIICCSDGAAEAVIGHYDEIKEWYAAPSLNCDISQLMSKQEQGRLARESGFFLPESKVLSTAKSEEWDIYPCITKPIKSVIGGGKGDIRISHNSAELSHELRTTEADLVQIQRYIKKKMEFQLIGCSLNGGEIIIIPGYTDIIRQPDNTNTGYLLYSPISNLNYDKKAVETFIKKIGYSGLFSLEFIRDENGVDYFLEINMRNDGNAYCVKTAGVNLPFIWCYYQVNGRLPEEALEFDKPIWFMPEFSDIRRGIKTVGVFKWVQQFFTAKSHAVYNLRDMKPFWFQIRHIVIKRIMKSNN